MQKILFHEKGYLSDLFEAAKIRIKKEIDGFERDYLLKVKEEDLVKDLVDKYTFEPPQLRLDEKHALEPTEVDIDVSGDNRIAIHAIDRSSPYYVKGTSITIVIPFDGNGELFHYQPSSYLSSKPYGEVRGQEVHLVFQIRFDEAEQLKSRSDQQIDQIKRYLDWVNEDCQTLYNKTLEPDIRGEVKLKKDKLGKEMDIVKQLGIPIKRRANAPTTYTVPEIRRKPRIKLPTVPEKPSEPEPILEIQEYENILDILRNMVLVMEKSPRAFIAMKEEDLRWHFLVQLNGQYEGMATGETFNFQGKTDVLVQYKGKNVFIAECKFWNGEKSFLNAIDQLLGYTSWRDTKTAILIFNRNQKFSSVLEKIAVTARSHKCYKKDLGEKETEFRYTFLHPKDENRNLTLTVMAFNIPS